MLNEKRSEKVTDEEMDEMIEIVEVVRSITQERVSKRIVKQIMDKPVPQVAGAEHQGLKTTQQVVNTSVQHIKIPQVSDIPVVAPRQILPITRSHETTRVWDSACRRYGSACLEDGRIDRSPLSDFLEDGQGSRQRAVPCISEQ